MKRIMFHPTRITLICKKIYLIISTWIIVLSFISARKNYLFYLPPVTDSSLMLTSCSKIDIATIFGLMWFIRKDGWFRKIPMLVKIEITPRRIMEQFVSIICHSTTTTYTVTKIKLFYHSCLHPSYKIHLYENWHILCHSNPDLIGNLLIAECSITGSTRQCGWSIRVVGLQQP